MKNRSGSYKKILLNPDFLKSKLPYLQKNVEILFKSQLTPIELCTLYILLFLRVRHPENWLQKKCSHLSSQNTKTLMSLIPEEFQLTEWEKQKLSYLNCEDLFLNHNLKGIPQSVNHTMLKWMNGEWDIELFTHIPVPRELLRLQSRKKRCITLINDPQELGSLVRSSRDPLSFVLHDLMHADQFFSQEESLKGQLGFYAKIEQVYDRSELLTSLKKNRQFKTEFEYVVSDMNAYVIHLFKCLKSAFIKYDDKLFLDLLEWWQMPDTVKGAAHKINTPAFSQQDELLLKNYFEQGSLS